MPRKIASNARGATRAGRPPLTPAQTESVRVRVIEAARELFADEGFEAVSMRRIAAVAGCAPMTLYGYFRSKNEILRHIWAGFFDELFRTLTVESQAAGSAAARIRRVCAAYLAYWLAHPERYRMIYLNQDQAGDGERYYVDASPVLEHYGLFRDLIRTAQAEGTAWPGDAQVIGEALICGLHGLGHALITIPEYPWSATQQLLDHLLFMALRPESR